MPEPEMNTPPNPPPGRRSAFEWSLAALRPADADVARPSFMFKAGQASRDKAVRLWRCVAGGLAVLLVVGAVATFGLVNAEQQRATAVIERPAVPVPPAPVNSSAPESQPVVVVAPPLPALKEPTPAELAAALERRRNILVGGLGLIPDSPPRLNPEGPRTDPTYPGVFAAPRVEKNLPPAPDSDPDPP